MSEIITYLEQNILNSYKNKLLLIKNNFTTIKQEVDRIPLEDYNPFDDKNKNDNYWNVYVIKTLNKKIDLKNYAPNTYELLKDNSFVNVFFSLLKPNTKINPHKDSLHFFYRSHLGLTVPNNYFFICNQHNITTKSGEINFFNLTHEHQANNNSNENRIVLIVDILKDEYLGMPL